MNNNNYLIPAAIVVAGMFISGSLYLAITNTKEGDTKGATTTDTTQTGTTQTGTTPTATEKKVNIGNDPVLGNKDTATVAIVEYSDFECPFCKRHHEQTHPQLLQNYIDNGKAILVYKHYPLSFHDPNATQQALASECIQEIGGDSKFYEFSDLVYKTTNSNKSLAEATMLGLVSQIGGIDQGTFDSCYSSNKYGNEIVQDTNEGKGIGVTGTPGFLVGKLDSDGNVTGEVIVGAQPYATFNQAIEKYLK